MALGLGILRGEGGVTRDHGRTTVYVLDDDPSVRNSLGRLMRVEGYDVRLFASAEDFLREVTPSPLSCLLLDITLPNINGLEVQRTLNDTRPTGYTSVLKTMQIMLEKGLVECDDTRRPQLYRARYSRERTQKQFVTEVLQQVYRGSLTALVMHSAGTRKPSAEDIEEIETFLRELKRGSK